MDTAEKIISKTKEEIIKEAKRIEESTLYSSKGHFISAQFWSNFHLIFGIPMVLCAAGAGVSALSKFDKEGNLIAILSIAATALSALITFLNPNEKANTHLNSGNNYDSLQNRIRMFWSIDCWKEESEQVLTEKLKYFSEQKDKLNQTSPQIPWSSLFCPVKSHLRIAPIFHIFKPLQALPSQPLMIQSSLFPASPLSRAYQDPA